ncbi:MAG: hypothetical protein ABII13_04575 [Patescibacteria group bacterium]|nr:hypothetical protein [Patescibacteria group bacterium]
MNHKLITIVFLAVAVAIIGAGCGKSPESVSRQEAVGPKVSTFQGLTPQEATERINLVPGSVMFMHHFFAGFGSDISQKIVDEKQEVVRTLVIERFAPNEVSSLTWKLTAKTDDTAGVSQTLSGNLDGNDLKKAYSLYLPAYWPEKEHAPSLGNSAIWLSRDVFEGLNRNRVSTLYLGVLDVTLQQRVAESDFKDYLIALERNMRDIENRTDVYLLEGERDLVEWPLKVNGEDIKVEVIKASTWFADLVILNNAQNPVVLKLSMNPGIMDESLKSLLDYEIFELKDVLE